MAPSWWFPPLASGSLGGLGLPLHRAEEQPGGCLGVEVRRFLGHDIPGSRDARDDRGRDRVEQERRGSLAALDLGDGLSWVLDVAQPRVAREAPRVSSPDRLDDALSAFTSSPRQASPRSGSSRPPIASARGCRMAAVESLTRPIRPLPLTSGGIDGLSVMRASSSSALPSRSMVTRSPNASSRASPVGPSSRMRWVGSAGGEPPAG